MICYVDGEYFIYRGRYYKSGTKVKLSDAFIQQHSEYVFYSKEAWFSLRNFKFGAYIFYPRKMSLPPGQYGYCGTIDIPFNEIDSAIEEIIDAHEIDPANITVKKKDIPDENSMAIAILIYIVVLIGSLIFREFYLVWIFATIVLVDFMKGNIDRWL